MGKVSVHIRTAGSDVGQHIALDLEEDETVVVVKNMVSVMHPSNPSPEQQRLIYSGSILRDEQSLKDVLNLRLHNGPHVIHLVIAQRQPQMAEPSSETNQAFYSSTEQGHSHYSSTPESQPRSNHSNYPEPFSRYGYQAHHPFAPNQTDPIWADPMQMHNYLAATFGNPEVEHHPNHHHHHHIPDMGQTPPFAGQQNMPFPDPYNDPHQYHHFQHHYHHHNQHNAHNQHHPHQAPLQVHHIHLDLSQYLRYIFAFIFLFYLIPADHDWASSSWLFLVALFWYLYSTGRFQMNVEVRRFQN